MTRAALLATLLLSACMSPGAELPPPPLPQRTGVDPLVAARAEGVEFRAVGDGFVVDIFRADRIRFTRAPSGDELTFAKPEPRYPRWNGVIYETSNGAHTLTIRIRDDRPCQSADPATYPSTVEVVLDGAEFRGCGRRF